MIEGVDQHDQVEEQTSDKSDQEEKEPSLYYEETEPEEKKIETKNCPACELQEINLDEEVCKGCSEEATKEEVEEMLAANEAKKEVLDGEHEWECLNPNCSNKDNIHYFQDVCESCMTNKGQTERGTWFCKSCDKTNENELQKEQKCKECKIC